MYPFLGVFIGGGIGSVLRFFICQKITSHWGTMCVNIIGAFLIGVAYAYFEQSNVKPEIKLLLMTGFLGGFTTFSTYIMNFSTLMGSQNYTEAFFYLIFSVLIGIAFFITGCKFVSIL